ncbi:FecCD family ABC transporter permease [Aliikangiella sp. IMCC44359]|uniref:FecCD family ABC transporter permease n=1 Tax=Aliikangiella sp. IMCC44359 TaxID=3459125 RepID=UPI00403B16A2
MNQSNHQKAIYTRCVYTTIICIIISVPLVVMPGSTTIPLSDTLTILLNHLLPFYSDAISVNHTSISSSSDTIIWKLRFPRALLAATAGAGFAIAGTTLQVATRNILAEPHLLGVSSGAVLGAVIATLHLGKFSIATLGDLSLPICAFIGALLATLSIALINKKCSSTSPFNLLMSGVAISFILGSLANLLLFLGDHRASHQVIFWILGGFGLARWDNILLPFITCFSAYIYLLYQSSRMNALLLGDETAHSLGITVNRFRIQLFICSALITAVLIASCGAVGFIGLVMPHIARSLVGGHTRRVLTLSALLGALFIPWADLLARWLLAPEELPIGIITGLLGGLFFLFILNRKVR